MGASTSAAGASTWISSEASDILEVRRINTRHPKHERAAVLLFLEKEQGSDVFFRVRGCKRKIRFAVECVYVVGSDSAGDIREPIKISPVGAQCLVTDASAHKGIGARKPTSLRLQHSVAILCPLSRARASLSNIRTFCSNKNG